MFTRFRGSAVPRASASGPTCSGLFQIPPTIPLVEGVTSPRRLLGRRSRLHASLALGAALGASLLLASVGRAEVVESGSNNLPMYIGYQADGAVTVNAGSQVNGVTTFVGYAPDVTGALTVTGAGSAWINDDMWGRGTFTVGYEGHGSLTVSDGARVSHGYGHVGYLTGSTGTVLVTGTGSVWSNSESLYVAGRGTGSLTVSDGGKVTARTLFASLSDLSGDGTIEAKGLVSDVDLVFDSTHGKEALLAFGTGGTLRLTLDSTGGLGAGYKGEGSLRIADGLIIASNTGELGYHAGSVGTATVTGAGSKWTQSEWLNVGYSGTGSLTVSNGAQVSTYFGYLGRAEGGVGTATVTGAGSAWACNYSLYVGRSGSGSLTVSDGALVTSRTLFASLSDLSGDGTITVKGLVSDVDLVFDSTHAPGTPLAFGSGGTLNLTLDGTGDLGVGYRSEGSLRIADGQTIASYNGYLGYNATSAGTATVTGAGSKWSMSYQLLVGNKGNGSLAVSNGAQVSDSSGYLGLGANSVGTATVTGAGSKWTQSGSLYVGYEGTGSLTVSDGAQVSDGTGYVGYRTGSTGTVLVSGAGSTWTTSGALHVSYNGNGSLHVSDGGMVTAGTLYALLSDLSGDGTIEVKGLVSDVDLVFDSTHSPDAILAFGAGGTLHLTLDGTGGLGAGYRGEGSLRIADGLTIASTIAELGYHAGSVGTATVTGAGSKWTHSDAITIGYGGTGSLTVSDGAQVSSKSGYLGRSTNGIGAATVTGTGSKWTHSGTLYVGYDGNGSLTVSDGAQVGNGNGYVGYSEGSTGTVLVTGPGSIWSNSESLYIASYGTGSVTVRDGGKVTARTLYASLSELAGDGAIEVKGLVSDVDLVFDSAQGPEAIVAFGTGGNLHLACDGTGDLGVGYRGEGSLRIADGRTIATAYGYLGYYNGSTGTAVVTGAGSAWANSGQFYVGRFGNGSLTVSNGARVSDSNATVGYSSGTVGAVTVTGPGSVWTNSGTLNVGYSGNGSLTVSDGAQVSNTNGYLGYNASGIGTASVTGAGSKWTHSSTFYVGYNGNGSLTISDGAQVSNTNGYLGYNANSIGTAIVTGAGSKWTHSGALYVGYNGSGSLTVSHGAQVSSANGYVGYGASGVGSAIVTGAGSVWTNSATLYVDYNGSGCLHVSDGGLVTARTLYASLGDLSGNGTIEVKGLVSDVDVLFDSTHGPDALLAFGAGGTLRVTCNGTGDLGAGYRGEGSLRIADGLTIASTTGFLGYYSGSAGTASVTGAGSKWTNSGTLNVGYNGNGSLTVSNGAQVSDSTGYLGNSSSSVGTASVTGTGSKWTHSGTFYVGYNGNGSLTISDGALVSDSNGHLGYNASGIGAATVTGAGSKWTHSASLNVGYNGSGSLTIANGAQVSNANGYVGYGATGVGSAVVTGAGSTWTSSDTLYVGYNGRGSLAVSDGGLVTARTLYASQSDLSGNGTITVKGLVSDADLVFDSTHGTEALLAFGAGGTLRLTLDGTGALGAGYRGEGSLRIADGLTIASPTGFLGYYSGSAGTASVTGAGSKWTHSGALNVGYNGNGNLAVSNGAQVSDSNGYLGYNASGTGTASVTGAGSKWTHSSALYVGYTGSGSLTISNGAQVADSNGYLGYNANSTGTATVTGAGATWTHSDSLYVGYNGNGNLTVSDGGVVTARSIYASLSNLSGNGTINADAGVFDGQVTFDSTHAPGAPLAFGSGGTLNLTLNGTGSLGVGYKGEGNLRIADGVTITTVSGYVGYNSGSTGTATLTGAGSKWTNKAAIHVGYSGSGSLTVSDGAQLNHQQYADGYVGYNANSVGALTITGTGSKATNCHAFYVGYFGNGSLTISNGAQVSNGVCYLGFGASGVGAVTVTGAGSTWTNSESLSVGYNGRGSLTISNGAQVSNSESRLAYNSGSVGTATVTGAGSKWTHSGSLYVGYSGNGSLTVSDGAQVSNSSGYVGYGLNSIGTATVTGAGSKWTHNNSLFVGYYGKASLTVSDGGLVTARTLLLSSFSNLYGNGTIDVKGLVSDMDLVFDSTYDPGSPLAFGSGGTLNLTLDGTGDLGAGYTGKGSLRIADGVTIASNTGYLGYSSVGVGTATVTGAGSTWTNSDTLYIGNNGHGSLTVGDGGVVSARSLQIMTSASSLVLHVTGNGMIVLGNAISNGSLTNNGKIKFYADADLPAGTYRPISPYTGKTLTWSGSTGCTAFGGTWNSTAKTFTVGEVIPVTAGTAQSIASGQRLDIRTADLRDSVSVSFGTVAPGVTFSARPMNAAELALLALQAPDHSPVAAWNFSTSASTLPALLTFDVGEELSDLSVWNFADGIWSAYTPDFMENLRGVLSFTVNDFSGYAVVGPLVPEPTSLLLLACGMPLLLRRRSCR